MIILKVTKKQDFTLFLEDTILEKPKQGAWWSNHSIICEDLFSIRYVPDQYKTQPVSDNTVDGCLAAINLFLIGLLQTK